MKNRCEMCSTELGPADEAWICSYECTYCPTCRSGLESCPNCAGELAQRPRRTTGITQVAVRTPARLVRRLHRASRLRR